MRTRRPRSSEAVGFDVDSFFDDLAFILRVSSTLVELIAAIEFLCVFESTESVESLTKLLLS